MKIFPQRKLKAQIASLMSSIECLKKKISILHKTLQKAEEEGTLANLFCKTSINYPNTKDRQGHHNRTTDHYLS